MPKLFALLRKTITHFSIAVLLLAGCAPAPKKVFSIASLSSHLPYRAEWEGRVLSEQEMLEVEGAFLQDYSYLGGGGQCEAFVSGDGRYVLKFFKQKAFAPPEWVQRLPSVLTKKKTKKADSKREKVFSAFVLCHKELSCETALMYLHLNRTSHLKRTIQITGPDRIVYAIALDEMEFALQKRADLAFAAIDRLDLESAKKAIDKLLDLHLQLYLKGIRNRDANFRSNCGFIGEEPVVIDVGRIVISKEICHPENYQREFERIAPRFRRWLTAAHPELLEHFEESIAKISHSKR